MEAHFSLQRQRDSGGTNKDGHGIRYVCVLFCHRPLIVPPTYRVRYFVSFFFIIVLSLSVIDEVALETLVDGERNQYIIQELL